MSSFSAKPLRLALAALAVACGVALAPRVAEALVPTLQGTLAFGGIIVWTHPCTMTSAGTPGWYMTILDKSAPYRPFSAVLLPVSRLNMYFAPVIGNSVLGGILPVPGVCTISAENHVPYLGFVPPYPYEGMGTSLVPFAGNLL